MDKQTALRAAITVTLVIAGLVWFGYEARMAVERQEAQECARWATDAAERPAYTITHWQKEQCDTYGIPIHAAVF